MKVDFVPFHSPIFQSGSMSPANLCLDMAFCWSSWPSGFCDSRARKNHVAQLGGLTWKRNQFCRGWLITGDTGSGKTSSGINQLAHQVFQTNRMGRLCIDEKGVYWEDARGDGKILRARARPYSPANPRGRFGHAMDAAAPLQLDRRPQHSLYDIRQVCHRYGNEPGTRRWTRGFSRARRKSTSPMRWSFLFDLRRPVTLACVAKLLTRHDFLKEQIDNLGNWLKRHGAPPLSVAFFESLHQ